MAPSAVEILLSVRQRSGDASQAAVEEYFRLVGQRIRARLVGRCSGDFDVLLGGIEVQATAEVGRGPEFSDDAVAHLLSFDHLPVGAGIVMERKLLTRIISAMLGADEDEDPDELEALSERPLSAVEQRIARRVFSDVAAELAEAWPASPAPAVRLRGSPVPMRNAKLGPERTDVYVARFEVGLEDTLYGVMVVAIPAEIMRKLGHAEREAAAEPARAEGFRAERVADVELDVVAELGRIELTVAELRALAPGDLLPLRLGHRAVVRVNGLPLLVGEAGHASGQRSVRVTGRAR